MGQAPKKICEEKTFWGILQGSCKNRAASFVGGYLWGPRKDFFAEKDFWEKEEQALKTWCLPSGK